MEFVNYLASLLLLIVVVFLKLKPSLLIGYNSLPKEKQKKYPFKHLLWGVSITAFFTPVMAYNIDFLGYPSLANWTFLIVIPLGVSYTIWRVARRLNKN